jgi:putative PIN family toxin of toxin-antitoxin system
MLDIVLDTNVFISACLGQGAANRVVELCLLKQFQPLMSATLLAEYEAVLSRDALFVNCALSATEREQLLDVFLAQCRLVRIYYRWRPNLSDEADNHLLELALAGQASHLITQNRRDFAYAQLRFPSLTVLTAAAFLQSHNRH